MEKFSSHAIDRATLCERRFKQSHVIAGAKRTQDRLLERFIRRHDLAAETSKQFNNLTQKVLYSVFIHAQF